MMLDERVPHALTVSPTDNLLPNAATDRSDNF